MDILKIIEEVYTKPNIILFVGIMMPLFALIVSILYLQLYRKYKKEKYKKRCVSNYSNFQTFTFSAFIPSLLIYNFGFVIYESYWFLVFLIPYIYLSIKFDKATMKYFKKITGL